MSRVYDTYCDTRDDIYIAMGDAGLRNQMARQMKEIRLQLGEAI